MGLGPEHDWVGGYYQYANRIATLHFLNSQGCPARLLFVYFTGDDFTGKTCPRDQKGWQKTVQIVKRDLGLDKPPADNALMRRIHDVFLPCCRADVSDLGPAAWLL